MSLLRKIPGDFRSDMVSDEEIMSFLQQKVAEKYPQGEVEATKHPFGNGMDFQIRTSPAAIGVYNAVSCAVQVWRKKDGKMLIQVNVADSDGTDLIQLGMALFTARKRGGLVDEVAGWLAPFLQNKQNQPHQPLQENTANPSSRKCIGCGAEIPPGESVCSYCGASMQDDAVPSAVPAAPAPAATVPQPVDQAPVKHKNTYLLLGILLGGLGIHNFYAGYTKKGVIQLLITLLTAGYGGVISWIWAIIEICTVKQDAKGTPFA